MFLSISPRLWTPSVKTDSHCLRMAEELVPSQEILQVQPAPDISETVETWDSDTPTLGSDLHGI